MGPSDRDLISAPWEMPSTSISTGVLSPLASSTSPPSWWQIQSLDHFVNTYTLQRGLLSASVSWRGRPRPIWLACVRLGGGICVG